ncbi:Vmc-like lipoprotein signal peptide domain-containing protein [Mesoplasma lactucae]|uniref:Uncharacterized protein n=1 Tax=Mesoplasma lactucae ATCC 49193 TaxID=81460 RepID=A0A291IRP3_9MOLU|nr:lipoprotein [Mesoplasma lactucae]ATG97453.1 hypothetical protein CP520_01620 [Mesoplasma lactucae ATCC 49193]ATZ20092.1 hypothetical protein MLACT_v1c02710 [Mesoplasma lactucae ATCC 49193]MCL8216840.1 hypothetical protein [Mesoplasma lactucae ATCC 49193]
MKKWLGFLSSIALLSTTTTTVVSCGEMSSVKKDAIGQDPKDNWLGYNVVKKNIYYKTETLSFDEARLLGLSYKGNRIVREAGKPDRLETAYFKGNSWINRRAETNNWTNNNKPYGSKDYLNLIGSFNEYNGTVLMNFKLAGNFKVKKGDTLVFAFTTDGGMIQENKLVLTFVNGMN